MGIFSKMTTLVIFLYGSLVAEHFRNGSAVTRKMISLEKGSNSEKGELVPVEVCPFIFAVLSLLFTKLLAYDFNPIACRKAKIAYTFGLSACKRVKKLYNI